MCFKGREDDWAGYVFFVQSCHSGNDAAQDYGVFNRSRALLSLLHVFKSVGNLIFMMSVNIG